MDAFTRALSKITSYFSMQKALKRELEYEELSPELLLSLISENLNRLTMDFAVLREKLNDGKIQHDNGGSDKKAE
jgi:hypothetical protein